MTVFFYIGAILAANWLSSQLAPISVLGVMVSLGTFTIGLTFIFRDLVQNQFGRGKTYGFIALAMGLSALMAMGLGDGLPVVIASAIAFTVSETTDTEIYSRLKLPMYWRVWWSGLVGGILDSSIFLIIGLSPLGMGFIPWSAIPAAIVAQAGIKALMQAGGAVTIRIVKGK